MAKNYIEKADGGYLLGLGRKHVVVPFSPHFVYKRFLRGRGLLRSICPVLTLYLGLEEVYGGDCVLIWPNQVEIDTRNALRAVAVI